MGCSAKVVLRRPARKDGTCQVRLIVILDGRLVPVALKVNWLPVLFDENAGRCVASLPKAERGPDYAAQLEAGQAYLSDAQEEEGLPGFRNYTDQYENRALTAIGLQLAIETHLHHHIDREMFTTEFIRKGGQVTILQKLMNHTKIATTMKYVHVDDDMKCQAVAALDAMTVEWACNELFIAANSQCILSTHF